MSDPIEIVSDISSEEANSYLSHEEVDAIMEGFPGMDSWDNLEEDARSQILIQGTRLIDQFKDWGPKRDDDQSLSFPRTNDAAGVLPGGVQRALAAFCNFIVMGDLVPLKTLQSEDATSATILGQTVNFKPAASILPSECRSELEKLSNASWGNPPARRDGEVGFFF